MAAEQVEAIRTPLEPEQAIQVLSAALEGELGRPPTIAELKMVVAQSSLETARWQKMWNWNFGNSVAVSDQPYFVLRQKVVHRFRPFASSWQGATYYVALLRRRFSNAWQLLGSGDPVAYAYALRAQNYYEGDAAPYGRDLLAVYNRLGGPSSSSSATAPTIATAAYVAPTQPTAEKAGTGLAVLALLWWLQRRRKA